MEFFGFVVSLLPVLESANRHVIREQADKRSSAAGYLMNTMVAMEVLSPTNALEQYLLEFDWVDE